MTRGTPRPQAVQANDNLPTFMGRRTSEDRPHPRYFATALRVVLVNPSPVPRSRGPSPTLVTFKKSDAVTCISQFFSYRIAQFVSGSPLLRKLVERFWSAGAGDLITQ